MEMEIEIGRDKKERKVERQSESNGEIKKKESIRLFFNLKIF